MSGNTQHEHGPAIELAREADFALGPMTIRPSASEIVVDGVTRRVEPRVMQTLVVLAQANQAVVSRDELMARCWSGAVVGEDALTRAVGQVRRLSRRAPEAFTIETIPKIGYRLVRETGVPAATSAFDAESGKAVHAAPGGVPRAASAASAASATASLIASALKARHAKLLVSIAAAVVTVIAGISALYLPHSGPILAEATEQHARLGTRHAEARDLHLLAANLLDAGGRDNALRAETLLREALEIDPQFHSAKEALVIALMSAATFIPERAAEAYQEAADILDSEVIDTPFAWRRHLLRGFHRALEGDWSGAERALDQARERAPEPTPPSIEALETFLLGSVGRFADSLELVRHQAQREPLSRDRSRALQQWLNRTGRLEEAEAEYARSRDLPGDRSAIELVSLMRALGTGDAGVIEKHLRRYRETDWGRPGDDALSAVMHEPPAALELLRSQIGAWRDPGAMPPFLAAAWASYYGDQALALEGLRAWPDGLFATSVLWDPVFAETRRTASFKALLRDFGYVEYWRAVGAWGDFCRPTGGDDVECR